MSDAAAKKHPYHMVEPSKWPMVGSIAAFALAIGGVVYMHDGGPIVLLTGFGILLYTFIGWWRDVVRESQARIYHTEEVRHGLRVGFILFIASEVMFFFAFFWAFFHASVPFLSRVASPVWPPEGIATFSPWTLPFLNTLILLTSGAAVTLAHQALLEDNRGGLEKWLLATVILGFLFLGFQGYEYSHAAFGFADGIYPSIFFMATGFHGFHVFVGACFLTVCYLRAKRGHFTKDRHVGFEAAAWYWHFVDVVWLFLFVGIYWWGG